MIDSGVIDSLLITSILSILTPIVLVIFFKWKYKISLKLVFGGVITFILFSQVLGGGINFLLLTNSNTGDFINQTVIYVIYVALSAGVFEEIGRFLVLKYMYKRYREWKDGLGFGLGHGGIESILVFGISSFTMIQYAKLINAGEFEKLFVTPEVEASLLTVQEQLIETTATLSYLGLLERLCAITIHIALSILVLYGIKVGKKRFLAYSISLHTIFNIPAGLYQKEVLQNLVLLESILIIFAVIGLIFIIKSKRHFNSNKSTA